MAVVERVPQVAEQSFQCVAALPSTVARASSREADWSSLLVDYSRSTGVCEEYSTVATPDQTLVVVIRGEVEVSCQEAGVWRKSLYGPGTVGRTEPGESDRLVWKLQRTSQAFDKIHVFIPDEIFVEAAAELRRPGTFSPEHPSYALAFPDPFISQTASTLVRAARAGSPNLYAEVTGRMLAVHLLTHHAQFGEGDDDERSAGHISDRRLARVVEYMSAHLDQAISLDALASEAGMSKFHFARLFRERTGQTPVHFLTRLRMEAARRLLNSSETSIGRLAAMCGYPNPAHFSMAYRRHFGVSPRDVRRIAAAHASIDRPDHA